MDNRVEPENGRSGGAEGAGDGRINASSSMKAGPAEVPLSAGNVPARRHLVPCDQPCPKCGSRDIYGRFYRRDEEVEVPLLKEPPSWAVCINYRSVAPRDLIACHCRWCQYDFSQKPLPKPRRALTVSAPPDD